MERLAWVVVKDIYDKKSQKPSHPVYRLSAQNELLLHEQADVRATPKTKKKKKPFKALDFE